MGFSDDFKRAMKEAVYGDQADAWKAEKPDEIAPTLTKDAESFAEPAGFAPYEDTAKSAAAPSAAFASPDAAQKAPPVEPPVTYSPQGIAKPTYEMPKRETTVQDEVMPEYVSLRDNFEDVNTTVFSSGTVVRGTVESDGAVSMKGELIGDINCKADLTVTGRIQGGVTAEKILLEDAVIQGDINCGSTINITAQTQVMGNLTTKEAIIDGRIMGNISAEGAVIAGETAVIVGDITAYTVQIRKGSYFEGRVIMTGAAGDKTKLFNKFKLTDKK
ncbi:MAG: polymer-forming cytoskeletal protein [Hydrogenoanaerobacterium sp.]